MNLKLCILLFILNANWVCAQNSNSHSSISNDIEDQTTHLSSLIDSSKVFKRNNIEKSKLFADSAIELATRLKDSSKLILSYYYKAAALSSQAEFNSAQELLEKAIALGQKSKDSMMLALAHDGLTLSYVSQGRSEKAIDHCLLSIQLLEKLDKPKSLARVYNNLAGVYKEIGEDEKTLATYHSCLDLAIQNDDSLLMSVTWYNLALEYSDKEEFTDAKLFLDSALKYTIHNGDKYTLATIYNLLGTIDSDLDDNINALIHYRKSKSYYEELGIVTEIPHVLYNMAVSYEEMGDMDMAVKACYESIDIVQETKNWVDLKSSYRFISELYQDLNQPDSSLLYYKAYVQLKDSLFNEEKNRQIVEIQEKYESAKKDQSIAELNQKQARQANEIEQRNLWLLMIGLLSIGAIIIGFNYYQKLKVHRKLAHKELELNKRHMVDLLRQQEIKATDAFMEGELAERERLAGELHDRLGSQLATVKLHFDHALSKNLPTGEKELLGKANNLLGKTCVEVRQLAHDLVGGTLQKTGLISALENLGKTISDTGKIKMHLDAYEFEKRLRQPTELALLRVVQELVSNTIKYAEASQVTVQLVEYDEYLTMMVSDDGKGFDVNSFDKRNGMGLQNIANRIEGIKGTFTIDSQPGHGTTAVIEVPISEHLKTEEE